MLVACNRFNALPLEQRERFFDIVLDRVHPETEPTERELAEARATMKMLIACASDGPSG
jgi:hypothetical protein